MSVETKLPDGYEFREGYLYRDGACISNFFARPTALYHRQGDAFPFACDLEIHQASGSKVLEHFLLSDLSDDWWKEPPPSCYYVSQQKNTHRAVRFVFQSLMEAAPVTSVEEISELGWHRLPSGQMTYIAGKDILADNASIDSKHLWISDKIKGVCIESEPDTRIDDALQFFWDFFFLMPGITDILLTYTFLSFLSPLFRDVGIIPRFPLILEGPTESKKTTLACLACGTFMRKSNPRHCVVGLTSTRSAVELRARGMQHCVLIVDDLFPDGKAPQKEKALALIRDVANQDARETRSGNSLVSNKMDCGVVLTAEFFPSCGQSTRTRCLRLKLFRPIQNALLKPFQDRPALLGNVFKAFLQKTAIRYSEIVSVISEDFQKYRASRAEEGQIGVKSERLAEIGFCLVEALDIVLKIFPREDANCILKDFQARVNAWIDWQLSPEATMELCDVVSILPELQRQHPDKFFSHNNCTCITPDELCKLVRTRFGDPTITKSSVLRVLQDRGVLVKDRSNVATKKIAGRRYLFLRP